MQKILPPGLRKTISNPRIDENSDLGKNNKLFHIKFVTSFHNVFIAYILIMNIFHTLRPKNFYH